MEEFITFSLNLSIGILIFTVALVLYRLVIGPSIADRVTAFDVLTSITIGLLSVFAIMSDKILYIDAIFILSFVAFFGAIAFSYYMKKRIKR
jgi:multicomponent Na+:H+ antiporter subunit F